MSDTTDITSYLNGALVKMQMFISKTITEEIKYGNVTNFSTL